jgi:hypothetical protein
VETLAEAVEQLRREVAIRVRDNDALKAATTSGANYIQIGDVDSPVPTITTYTPPCPECVAVQAARDSAIRAHLACQEAWEQMKTERNGYRDEGTALHLALETMRAERDALAKRWAEMRQWFHTPMGTDTAAEKKMRDMEAQRG